MRICQLILTALFLTICSGALNMAWAQSIEGDVRTWLELKKASNPDMGQVARIEARHPDWPIIKSKNTPSKARSGWHSIHLQAREALEEGHYQRAYNLVSNTPYKDGTDFSEAEFLAGFIALQFLNNSKQALVHFERLHGGVNSVISKSRGAYWSARAAKAFGDQGRAAQWYNVARAYPVTFFGQKAFEETNASYNRGAILRSNAQKSNALRVGDTRFAAANYLYQINEIPYARVFLISLARDAQSNSDFDQAYAIAKRNNDRTALTKIARKEGVAGISPSLDGYPMLTQNEQSQIARAGMGSRRALVHAIVRQESEFDQYAQSHANARGMMQLLPSTATTVARRLGVGHDTSMLKDNPQHNILLGSAYLKSLIDRYNGSTILAVAAYNAGPGRVDEWLGRFGDPRTNAVKTENWIELIPFSETRNYIQRVTEGEAIYKTRL